MTTATIMIQGMSCMGCVNSVTKALKSVQGVQEANVDLQGNQATVTFDDTLTTIEALKNAVEEAGYEVN